LISVPSSSLLEKAADGDSWTSRRTRTQTGPELRGKEEEETTLEDSDMGKTHRNPKKKGGGGAKGPAPQCTLNFLFFGGLAAVHSIPFLSTPHFGSLN